MWSHVEQNADTEILSEYFSAHKTQPLPPGSSSSNKRDSFKVFNRRRINRSFTLSEPLIIPPQYLGDMPESQESEEIHASHPSHYYLEHVLAMGPSIFILWKAALLKKRILIYTPPPVETACLAVYNTCLLATIPFGTVAPRVKSGDRIQPLFCVGIHDMDNMMKATSGYVACTTDKLFLFKPQLFDVLVEIPASQPSQETYQLPQQTGPKISLVRESRGERSLKEVSPQLVDNRRYFTLFQQMNRSRRRQSSIQRRLRAESSNMGTDYAWRGAHPENNDGALSRESTLEVSHETGFKMSDTLKKMVTGGWWWWYGSDENEEEYQPFLQENEQSHAAQDIVPDQRLSGAHLQILQRPHADSDTEAIRFFHQLTQTLLSDLGRLISYKETAAIFSQEDHNDDDEGAHPVEITKEDMRDLGLDPLNDTEFVQELAQMYFGTQVKVQSGGQLWGCSQHTMEQKKRVHDRDDALRNVRRKSTPDDTRLDDPQPPVIKIEDSPPLTTLTPTEVRAEPAGTYIVVSTVTEHQPPTLGTTISPQLALSLPLILPAPHFNSPVAQLEAVRKRLLEHEIDFRQVKDKAWTPEEADHLDRYVALRQKRNNWGSPELPTHHKYGKDTPRQPRLGDTPHLLGPAGHGMHERELVFLKYGKALRPFDPVNLDNDLCPAHYKARPGLGPVDPRLARSPPRADPLVEPRGQAILPMAQQRQGSLPVASRPLPIEALDRSQRWMDTVPPQAQAEDQDQNQGPKQYQYLVQDQGPCQPDTKDDDDEDPVLLQYLIGDDCLATISVYVERDAKAAARRPLPVNTRRMTDYKEVTPDRLGRLVAETVAHEKQRLCD
ncbi:hypothetical protein BGZ59_006922 [Podila verticillata]|nr:hypothetical protein BGZ59_006922 [Podila verticillata]